MGLASRCTASAIIISSSSSSSIVEQIAATDWAEPLPNTVNRAKLCGQYFPVLTYCRAMLCISAAYATVLCSVYLAQGRRRGVDWGEHVHPTFARGCSWDWCKSGVFLRRGGGQVWSWTRQSVPYVNFKVAVLEFAYKWRWLWIVWNWNSTAD